MTELTLRGFQSHKVTALKFWGRLCCVTGPNNVGKTSFVRAARWLMYDALRGSRFFKKGEPQAEARLAFDDAWVERFKEKKSGGANGYRLSSMESPLEAIGKGAPPEVEKALGIWPIRVDKDLEIEANVVQQKDHPFLMDVPGTAKAKVLNALTGHHVLDVAIRETAAKARSLKIREKELDERSKALRAEFETFADLPAKEEAVAKSRGLVEAMLALVDKARRMRESLSALSSAAAERDALLAKATPDVRGLDELSARMDVAVQRATALREASFSLASANSALATAQSRPVPNADGAERLLSALATAQQRREALLALRAAQDNLTQATYIRDCHDRDLEVVVAKLSSFAGQPCSECGRPLTAECLQEATA